MLANAGLPMIVVELPVMVIALAPIVLIEAETYRRIVPIEWSEAWRGSLVANLVSTFIGIPLAWFAQVVVQMLIGGGSAWGLGTSSQNIAAVTLQSAWLIPYEEQLHWMIPAAALFLMLPAFAVSLVVERRTLKRYWSAAVQGLSLRPILIANTVTYMLLAAFWGVQLQRELAS